MRKMLKKEVRTSSRQLSTIKNDVIDLSMGKLQPQALELEKAVLGALLIDSHAVDNIGDILSPESFYLNSHQEIFSVIRHNYEAGEPIDILAVQQELKRKGSLETVGGIPYLVELTNQVGSSANIEYHARIIAEKHIQRDLIRVSSETIENCFDETKDVFDTLDAAEKGLFDVTQNNLTKNYTRLGDVAIKARKNIDELSKKEEGVVGVPSGFTQLDALTSGWQKSDLIIIAARPGMGKTAFTLALARNAAIDHNKGVAFFSLEMSDDQLATRLIAMESEVNSRKLRSGTLSETEWDRVNDVVDKFNEIPIFIDDTPAINIFELRAKCRRLVQKEKVQLIVIDYLQLMSGGDKSNGNRQEEISKISRSLKGLAKELGVPVIALSQLSRAVETRGGDKRPVLSDLRESGAIEQDADIVMFIYRPAYYQTEESQYEMDLAELIIGKHRNGETGTVELKYRSDFVKFENRNSSIEQIRDTDLGKGQQEFHSFHSKMNKTSEDGFDRPEYDDINPF